MKIPGEVIVILFHL